MWWLLLACGNDADIDPWAPPPLPDGTEVPSGDKAALEALEALVGGTIDGAAVGAWIGQASTPTELGRRLQAAQLSPVEQLVLSPGTWDADRVTILAEADLPDLRSLDASGAKLTAGAASALAHAGWLGQLTHLDLSDANLDSASVRALAAGDLRAVQVLRLADNALDDDAIVVLLSWRLGPLAELDLSGSELTEPGFRALAGSARMDHVRRLSLARCGADERAVFALTTSPYVATLEHLDLRDNGLGAADWSTLRSAFGDDGIPTD